MCLGIPMRLLAVEGDKAQAESQGVRREVALGLLAEPVVAGDFVMVHVGYAIAKIEPVFARSAWETWQSMHAEETAVQQAGEPEGATAENADDRPSASNKTLNA